MRVLRLLLASPVLLAAPLPAQQDPLVPSAPRVLWHYPDTGSRYDPPEYAKGMVYVGGRRLVALNPETGTVLHAADGEGPWLQPRFHRDLVLARHKDGSVHAWFFTLDRHLWKAEGLRSSWFTGAVCGDAFVVGSGTELVALALADGNELWRVDTGAPVEMTPVADARRVYVGTGEGVVLAVDGKTGDIAWRFETGAEMSSSNPAIADGLLLIADRGIGDRSRAGDRGKRTDEVEGARGGALHAFDVATGKHLWGRIFGATGFSTPHLHGDTVWGGFGRVVAPFDRATGAIDFDRAIRTGANAFGSPTVIGDRLVFGNLDGTLYVHELERGELVWSFEPPGDRTQVGRFLSVDGRLFVNTTVGMYAIGHDPEAPAAEPGFVLRPSGND